MRAGSLFECRFVALLGVTLLVSCGGSGPSTTEQPPQSLSYPPAPKLVVGRVIAPLTPSVTGTVTAYAVSPATAVARRYGVTPALDTGDVLAQRAIPYAKGASVFAITAQLFRMGADMLVTAVERLELRLPGTPQEGAASYQSWPSRDEIRALRRLGGRLIYLSDLLALRSQSV
jgi:hypothetical protein